MVKLMLSALVVSAFSLAAVLMSIERLSIHGHRLGGRVFAVLVLWSFFDIAKIEGVAMDRPKSSTPGTWLVRTHAVHTSLETDWRTRF